MSGDSFDIQKLYSDPHGMKRLVRRLKSEPRAFELSIDAALHGRHPVGWRAAWVIFHAMEAHDRRLQQRVGEIVAAIANKPDGHQRELLRILLELHIGEDSEGPLFDICMTLWEDLGKPPAVRYFAIQHILSIAGRYPELKNDLRFVVEDEYLAPLSPGIRKGVRGLIKRAGL